MTRTPLARRLSRYTAGSVVATLIGQAAFVVLYALGVPGGIAAPLAFAAGFVPNYVLNRWWTWQRRGRPAVAGEVLPYVAVIAASVAAASGLTALAERGVVALGVSRPTQVMLVTVAFWGITALLFAAKFVAFDRVVFRDPSQPRR